MSGGLLSIMVIVKGKCMYYHLRDLFKMWELIFYSIQTKKSIDFSFFYLLTERNIGNKTECRKHVSVCYKFDWCG